MAQKTLRGNVYIKPKAVKKTPRGIPQSLLDAIMEEPDRFCKEIKGNTRIIDFGTFVAEYKKAMSGNNAQPYLFEDLDKELLRILFRSNTVRNTIEKNIGTEEANKVYQQETQSTLPTITTAPPPLILPPQVVTKIGDYKRGGKTVHGYTRMKPRKWSNPEVLFLRKKVTQAKTPAEIIYEYREHFGIGMDLRQDSSIKTKMYRLK
jgi:hypothetical protein